MFKTSQRILVSLSLCVSLSDEGRKEGRKEKKEGRDV
jgi:hypothetical protein